MQQVGLVLADPPGDGSWVDAAVVGAGRAHATGVPIEVVTGPPGRLPPGWAGALAHGGQLLPWLRELRRSGETRPLVLTDLPDPADVPPGVTTVDWGWAEGARLAGALAAGHAGGAPVGLLAGPAVPTQQRVVAGFRMGALTDPPAPPTYVLHLASFTDAAADTAAAYLVGELGCAVLAHACDAAGERACARARALGAATIGFLAPLGDHLATITSDISGVVARLLAALAAGDQLPPVVRCTPETGEIGLTVRAG